jgi:hypothetical protein
MCICITFCLTWQLFSTTLIGPVTFQGRELCVLLLHSAVPDSYLTLLLIGPVTFQGRELCVLVLHSAGLDSYLTFNELIPWHLKDSYIILLWNISFIVNKKLSLILFLFLWHTDQYKVWVILCCNSNF